MAGRIGRPKGSKNKPKNEQVTVQSETTAPVRDQVRKLSGFETPEQLEQALPESTTVQPGEPQEKRKYTRRPKPDVDPAMGDPKYQRAVAKMTAFGGSRVVRTGFKTASVIMQKQEIDLSENEQQEWDDYFYVVGKKSSFDPTRPWYLILYGLLLLGEQIVVRLWQSNANSFTNKISELFGFGVAPESEQTESEKEEINEGNNE